MPNNTSAEIKIRTVHQRQKNGDIYVLERRTQYDPVKKYNVVLSTRLIGKIPKDGETMVPTRPKRPVGEKSSNLPGSAPAVSATRRKVGMMDIIDHIGKSSGIDDAIYANTDQATAQKILSLARYLLATNGQSFPGITTWQYTHPLPYEYGLSEDVYHELFERIGRNESLIQSFFASRLAAVDGTALLAYDSTTISTYSGQISEARYGFNKAQDGLETVKLLALYSIDTRQPVAFTKQPGNLPDVITVENALKQLQVLGINRAEIVTDNGYYSEKNLADMLYARFNFITLTKVSIKWVKKELDQRLAEFRSTENVCPFDVNTYGITVTMMREFSRVRKHASREKGLSEGDEETFRRRIYLHLYFNPQRQVEQDAAFNRDILELKALIESGVSEEGLSESAAKKAKKYLFIRQHGSKITVTFNENAISAAKKYHGYFALVSNCEKNAFECLHKYRRRETVELFFEAGKQKTDGTRTRVWSSECLMGRMFVQFVALCYYEYLSEQLRQLKKSLELESSGNGTAQEQSRKKKLLTWLKNTPVYLILQWFDAVEMVKVSSNLLSKRWSTEISEQDRLFLEELGVSPS